MFRFFVYFLEMFFYWHHEQSASAGSTNEVVKCFGPARKTKLLYQHFLEYLSQVPGKLLKETTVIQPPAVGGLSSVGIHSAGHGGIHEDPMSLVNLVLEQHSQAGTML